MRLTIDPKSAVPVSEQIAEGIRFAIARGRLAAGERLPGVRTLARDLLVNPNTVAKVYRDLERDGVLRTRPGSGAFVGDHATARCRRASRTVARTALETALEKALAAGLDPREIEELVRGHLEVLEGAGATSDDRR
jgi:GntR family transcriptional regulator